MKDRTFVAFNHTPIFSFLSGVCLFELCGEKSNSKYC